ncbi:MAG: NAD(P)H-hydrate dehydratase [Anaerolineales bacterium]|nr:NAD(P)H-hydrate dehydratase [Anaerolineales bacterium]
MRKIATRNEIIGLENAANKDGLSFDQMMENAGRSTAEEIISIFQDLHGYRILILIGGGNNGGDGLVAGRYLKNDGADVILYLSHARKSTDQNYKKIIDLNCTINEASNDSDFSSLREEIGKADILVDALLGTGFSLPLKGTVEKMLKVVQDELVSLPEKPFIVAVDCPSGLDIDTGEVADAVVNADITVSFAVAKHGFFKLPGAAMIGQLKIVDIGIQPDVEELSKIDIGIPEVEDIRGWMPSRPLDAHKGTFGKLLVIAGSVNFPGAAALTAIGAYRSGAGLVTMAVPGNIQHLIAPQLPEATWLLLPHEMGVIQENSMDVLSEQISLYQACVIGPGIGKETSTRIFLERLLFESGNQKSKIGFVHDGMAEKLSGRALPPSVIDADALNLLAELENWEDQIPQDCVLTPHPGEMARLTKLSIEDIQQNRIGAAREFSRKWRSVVVLKGAFTVVAHPEGNTVIIPLATPALARAGSGDVLAGTIGSLMAQGMEPFQAAVNGAYLHGIAGKIAYEVIGNAAGVIASDIADLLPAAINEIG